MCGLRSVAGAAPVSPHARPLPTLAGGRAEQCRGGAPLLETKEQERMVLDFLRRSGDGGRPAVNRPSRRHRPQVL